MSSSTSAGTRGLANGSNRPPRRHDPRIDPPTVQDKRRLWAWLGLLCLTPLCLGVVVWAAVGLNGSYPTVRPPVPAGWIAVRGIYASISVPKGWSLQQLLSDPNGDSYYSGHSGAVGLSVVESDKVPPHIGPLPNVVRDFLGSPYRVARVSPLKLRNAAEAWAYRFALPGGQTGAAVLAWVKVTQTRVWVVATTVTPTAQRVLSTLTLAS